MRFKDIKQHKTHETEIEVIADQWGTFSVYHGEFSAHDLTESGVKLLVKRLKGKVIVNNIDEV